VVGFGSTAGFDRVRVPVATSMTPSLERADVCEIWRADGGSELLNGEGRHSSLRYRYGDELLFGCIALDEKSLPERDANALIRATEIAYQEIFEVLASTHHPHLIRIWNYLADINLHAVAMSVIGISIRPGKWHFARAAAPPWARFQPLAPLVLHPAVRYRFIFLRHARRQR
jgi:chorismatase FkbO-like protein